ncbi:restriction endonuclease subunit S [Lactobacillus amylovorus]|uniref:restriction endonuclease subunit S n=1 Tax=Lactobacillus amylovorus TaxID=1604 RepID=UPI00232C0DBB|nr:restriction endonuclease subunit S [Lactobacillus amylovorus]MDB6241718.1 restriction endonuclease subunit S [Lactobacillus amylovorus]
MNKKEVKKAPALRFKGFTNDWEQRKLGDIATFINGRAYSKNELLHQGKYKVLRVGNFYTNDSWYYSDMELDKKYYANYGDLLYTWSATFGPHIWKGEKVIYHYHIWKIILSDEITKNFTLQLLEHDKNRLLAEKNGSTMIHLTKKDMENKEIVIPSSTNEQDKVGLLLTKLDYLITLQQRKLKLLRTLKSGLSFKLFNKKHLNNLSQISLDQIGQTYSGLTGKSKKDFGHGHAFYVSYLNVNQNEIGNPKQIDRIEIDKKQNLVQKNDIFFTISSETPEEVGLTSLWPVSCKNLYLNSFCFGFRINTKMFIPLYLGYLFRSEYFREKVLPLAQGISRYNLSKNNVLKIKIGQEEIAIQEKYAKVMNDLDSDILRQKKKVKELKLCKKFLLQNMFI